MVHVPGVGRVRHRFDAGEHPAEPDDPGRAAATRELGRVMSRSTAGVPDSVDDVKAWVGDDPDRAAVALEVERTRARGPRTTLEPWLEGLASPDHDDDADTTGADEES